MEPADDGKREEQKYQDELYRWLDSQRQLLNEARVRVAGSYEKAFIYTVGGGLAISVLFLEKIAPSPTNLTFTFLMLAWLCLVSSLLLHILAISFSQRAVTRQLEILDTDYALLKDPTTRGTVQGQPNLFTKATHRTTEFSIFLAIFGIASLCIFSVASIRTKIQNAPSDEQSQPSSYSTTTDPARTTTRTNKTAASNTNTSEIHEGQLHPSSQSTSSSSSSTIEPVFFPEPNKNQNDNERS